MGGDVASLAAEMTPYISAAAAAYGGAVLARARDDAADATVGLGRRLLQRVFGARGEAEPLPEPLGDLVADPQDDDALAALRLLVRKTLAADPVLEMEVRSMLVGAPGVAMRVRAGRDAYLAGHDQTVKTQNNINRGTGPQYAVQDGTMNVSSDDGLPSQSAEGDSYSSDGPGDPDGVHSTPLSEGGGSGVE